MYPDPIEQAIAEQLRSVNIETAKDKLGRTHAVPYPAERRRTETILNEMVHKQVQRKKQVVSKKKRRKRRRGPRTVGVHYT